MSIAHGPQHGDTERTEVARIAIVAAVALLGKPVALSTILGGVLVLAGVLIVQTVE